MQVAVSSVALYGLLVARRESAVNPTLWYVTRAAGVSAYVLLATVVDLGILLSLGRQLETHVSWVLDELHQFLSFLAAALVALHLGALLVDPFITFSLANLLLPLDEPYQPLGITFGVIGLYALLVLLASSWLRRFLPRRFWRGLHYLSFVAFVLVTVHGVLAGSDADLGWMRSVYFAASASTLFLTVMRLVLIPRRASAPPLTGN
jgi:sulfoxide reductase heme-binding subunit YedZ